MSRIHNNPRRLRRWSCFSISFEYPVATDTPPCLILFNPDSFPHRWIISVYTPIEVIDLPAASSRAISNIIPRTGVTIRTGLHRGSPGDSTGSLLYLAEAWFTPLVSVQVH